MHVNLRRKPLPGSPFKAEVIPDTACAAASCIEDVLGVGSRRLVVGEQSAFVLQTLGRHGNACVAEGAHACAPLLLRRRIALLLHRHACPRALLRRRPA
jgi:hypothetical protein